MKKSKIDRPWSIPQLAEALGVSRQAVYGWFMDGKVKGFRYTKRGNVHIPLKEVERLIEERQSS